MKEIVFVMTFYGSCFILAAAAGGCARRQTAAQINAQDRAALNALIIHLQQEGAL